MMKRVVFILLVFILIFIRIFLLQTKEKNYYSSLLIMKTNNYVYGVSPRRGRILDINGNVLVDNKDVKTIYYNNIDGITEKDKVEIAYSLAELINIEEASELNQKKFILVNSEEDYLNEEEKRLFKERKLNINELRSISYSRVNTQELSSLDKKAAQIYYLMNKDYKYMKKEIKRNVSEEEYALILEKNLPGITGEITWERTYPYGDLLKSVFGTVGAIPLEKKEEYLNKGYSLSDSVGLSYLELQYDEYLKGKNAIYKVNKGKLLLIKEPEVGSDIYLNVDINIEQELVNKIKEEIIKAKSKPNTEYFHDLYASISNPKTGAIVAIAGIRYLDNGTFTDITSNIISSSFTVGSVVKAATIAVGYNNGLITPNAYITDSCVKLYLVPEKCSFKRLGRINDITALANSSNYYQYMIAIKLANKNYYPNIKLGVTEKEFNIYRNTLNTYGLGVKTEIDLPNEQAGIKGVVVADDLLLNLAIGQYDTYTNIQLLQYINTVATGNRVALSLANNIKNQDQLFLMFNPRVLNDLQISSDNLSRVRLGLQEVIKSGTGKNAADLKINPAGKTGTSESFYDSNSDGIVDIKTISTSLALYYPVEDPKYSIAIIAPHISHNHGNTSYTYSITKHISSGMTNFLFENY